MMACARCTLHWPSSDWFVFYHFNTLSVVKLEADEHSPSRLHLCAQRVELLEKVYQHLAIFAAILAPSMVFF